MNIRATGTESEHLVHLKSLKEFFNIVKESKRYDRVGDNQYRVHYDVSIKNQEKNEKNNACITWIDVV